MYVFVLCVDNFLYLPREELLAAVVHHLLEPPDYLHVSGRIELPEVARAEPAVDGEELGVRRRVLVIAEVDRRPLGRDLAPGARRDVASPLVDQPEAEARGAGPDRSRDRLAKVVAACVGVQARLDH